MEPPGGPIRITTGGGEIYHGPCSSSGVPYPSPGSSPQGCSASSRGSRRFWATTRCRRRPEHAGGGTRASRGPTLPVRLTPGSAPPTGLRTFADGMSVSGVGIPLGGAGSLHQKLFEACDLWNFGGSGSSAFWEHNLPSGAFHMREPVGRAAALSTGWASPHGTTTSLDSGSPATCLGPGSF